MSKFWTKVSSVSKGSAGFTKEVLVGVMKRKNQEEYVPTGFSKFMDALFLNPSFQVHSVRELESLASDQIKKSFSKKFNLEIHLLGVPISSEKRGADFPILDESFFFPPDLDFRFQRQFIEQYYPEHLPKDKKCFEPEGRYFPKMFLYRLKENDTGKFLIYYSGGAFLLNHHTIFAQFPKYYPDYNIVFVSYGLAPEYSYPQGILDGLDAYHIICNKYNPISIVLAGDSAGGHISLQVAVYVKSHFYTAIDLVEDGSNITLFSKSPSCLMLLSPWSDMSLSGRSVQINGNIDSIKPSFGLHKFRELYLGLPLETNPDRVDLPFMKCTDTHFRTMPFLTDKDLKRPQFSPVEHDLSGLPPIFIQTGNYEILMNDNQQLADRLIKAGNKCLWKVFPYQVHMWQSFPFLSTTKDSFTSGREFVDANDKHEGI
eukprot:NODE_336_length_10675_cov_0.185136.p3 type:complete len:429 gc:universal NODE_336_length_10675_cov_0.185136:636-1922(+)